MNFDLSNKKYWRNLIAPNFEKAEICLFGIPFDANCSISKGAASAPSVMRECSAFLPAYTMDAKKLPSVLYDMGDVDGYDYSTVQKLFARASEKKLTVMLGGDHSVSILTQKAFRTICSGKLGIIHIDAHADICDEYQGRKDSHACVLRRALENGYHCEDIAMVGIRSYEDQESEFLKSSKIKVYGADKAQQMGADSLAQELIAKFSGYDGVYVSFDIDAVDPSYAPGTGTPEAFGLPSVFVLRVLTEIFHKLPIKAFDIVEISPPLDVNNITSWLALKYMLEVFGVVCSDLNK